MDKKNTYEELEQRIKELEIEIAECEIVEKTLLDEKLFTETIIESLPGIFYFFDDEGNFLQWNHNFEIVSGYSGEEIADMHPLDFFRGKDKINVEKRIRDVFTAGQATVEADFVSKDGNAVPYLLTGRRLTIGKKNYLAGSGIDLTERKLVVEALLASEMQYRSFFENNHAVMLLIDPETACIEDANPAACAYYGHAREDLIKLKITDINTLSREEVFVEMSLAKTENRSYFNFRHRLASGEVRDVEVYSGPISVQRRTLLYSVIHDITERNLAAAERERLISELQKALAEVKTLRGFIPICSNCKKIRDDEGYWQMVEQYIQKRSDAQFSHGICPECAHELYPGLVNKEK